MTAQPGRNLILGALVADTAAMGTHWIYDQAHIRRIAPDAPEFMVPDPKHYQDVPAYFAHSTRQAGETSQYGEQALVMMDALAVSDGHYDPQGYAEQFRQHFGYGGAWVGYIDHATRETLNNFQRAEDAALERARALGGDRKVTTSMVTKALALVTRYQGEVLHTKFEEAVRTTHDDDETVAFGLKVLGAISEMPHRTGAEDEQMPATAKLPPLIASLNEQGLSDGDAFFTAVDSAVRTTNDHETALAWGRVCARMMSAALETDDMPTIVAAGKSVASSACHALITEAEGMLDQDNATATKHFGMACDLNYGVPSVVHNLLTSKTYREAIRRKIYAGGDTCGRAMILGAILGAAYGRGGERGVPDDWVARMRIPDRHRTALTP